MAKPTEEELQTALDMAAQMREKKLDPFFIAKSLLSHNYRIKHLEDIMRAADRYLNHGMSEQERMRLRRAIEKARELESYTASRQRGSFGLE